MSVLRHLEYRSPWPEARIAAWPVLADYVEAATPLEEMAMDRAFP
ncbi:MAG: hypothetical protein WD894_27055 [Pirellulales bacterium]